MKKEKLQRYQDDIDGISIEGRFGVAKRKYVMCRIKAKLMETSETEIYLSVLVMNLDMICAQEASKIKNRYKLQKKAG
ncbi:transposase [Spirochaeta cellobiosiphila]|uniref:transposase n=1 Tax=Spirochaeta cellobiosiphila TaxID=504483 RepID=UPI00048B93D4